MRRYNESNIFSDNGLEFVGQSEKYKECLVGRINTFLPRILQRVLL